MRTWMLALLGLALAAPACGFSQSQPAPPARAADAAPEVTLQPVDGGPDYYARFVHGLPTDPSYFPIGVWFESVVDPHDVDLDKAAGLNVYVVITANSDLALVRAAGSHVFAQSSERDQFTSAFGSETAAWELMDEIDMEDGPSGCTGRLQDIVNGLPADGRARYSNFGKGVLLWQTDAEAACFVDVPSIVSTDLYWFTDPWQLDMTGTPWLPEGERPMTTSEIRRASNYGYVIDRLRALDARDGQRKPIWAFVETGWPFTQTAAEGARAIEPREVRAAVWHSLIAGARGVIYFNHSFGGPDECQTQHVLRNDTGCYGAIRAMVTSINSQIKDLAPALNADTVTSGWTVGPAARAMVKWYDGHFYVFTAARTATGGTATFSLPCAGDATAVRLYEGGTIPVVRGQFSETFVDGDAVHLFRIDGGTSCGLEPAVSSGGGLGQPGGGGGPGGPGGPGATPVLPAHIGRARPVLPLTVKRVRVPVTCPTACSVRSRLTLRRAPHRVTLAAAARQFGPGRSLLVLRLTRRDRARIAQRRRVRLRTALTTSGTTLARTQRLFVRSG